MRIIIAITITILLFASGTVAQSSQQLTPPTLETTIPVYQSPVVNENTGPGHEQQARSENSSPGKETTATSPAVATPATPDPAANPQPTPEATGQRKNSNTILWLIIVGLAGIIVGRSFRK